MKKVVVYLIAAFHDAHGTNCNWINKIIIYDPNTTSLKDILALWPPQWLKSVWYHASLYPNIPQEWELLSHFICTVTVFFDFSNDQITGYRYDMNFVYYPCRVAFM